MRAIKNQADHSFGTEAFFGHSQVFYGSFGTRWRHRGVGLPGNHHQNQTAKGTATFINGPANLLNDDPKNPPDWIISEIWALESFMLVDIMLLNAFLNFVFYLVVNNNS